MELRPFGATGELVSTLGFGAAPLGDQYGAIDDDTARRTVHRALELGITLFDTSPYYGVTRSEARLGDALEGHRDEVFLVTKCGRYERSVFDFSAPRIRRSIDESLRRLRTDRVDLLLAHDVEFERQGVILEEALPAMVEARDAGKTRYIGVSGYPVDVLDELADLFPIDAVLTYCHGNLLARDAFDSLVPGCIERGQAVLNASTLHMGVLTPGGAPEWHPAPPEVHEVGRALADLCERHGRSLVDVALRFALDLPGVASTVVGARTPEEIEHNVRVLTAEAPPAQLLAQVEALVAPVLDRSWASGHWDPTGS